MAKFLKLVSSLAVTAFLSGSAFAAVGPNLALGKPVVGGSGAWDGAAPGGAPYDGGQFPAQFVTDNGLDTDGDPTNNSPMGEGDGVSWLGKEADVTEDFVLDFGLPTRFGSFTLVNTHNRQFNDRGTGDFQIFGSNTVAPRATTETGAGGVDLVNPVLLTSGTLGPYQIQANDPIEPQEFFTSNTAPFQYVRFNTLTALPQPGPALFGVGLNEFRAFTIPEPSSIALAAVGVGALTLRRRRR